MPRMANLANFKKPSGPFVTVDGVVADVTVVTPLALHTPLRLSVRRSVIGRVCSSVAPVSVSWVYTHIHSQPSLHTHTSHFEQGVSVHLQSAVVTFTSSLWSLEKCSLVIVPVWFLTFYLILLHSVLSFSLSSISLSLHPSVLSRCLRVMMTMSSPASSSVVTASSAALTTTRSRSGRLSQERYDCHSSLALQPPHWN